MRGFDRGREDNWLVPQRGVDELVRLRLWCGLEDHVFSVELKVYQKI